MLEINYLGLIVSGIAVFAASAVHHVIFNKQMIKLSSAAQADRSRPNPMKAVVEIVRNLVLAFVLGYFVRHLGVTTWEGAIYLSLIVWIGFPVVLLTGSVTWEKLPWQLAAIHMGDWLIKILTVTLILCAWY